jgi:hypothetical protein
MLTPHRHGSGGRSRRAVLIAAAVVMGLLVIVPVAWPQRRFRVEPNVPYDGKFTFVRVRYTQGYRMAWSADYPAMERNFMTILNELSTVSPYTDRSNVLTLDDPELFRYPVAYLTEPGYWIPTPEEAAGLRDWLSKGGFLWVDDFYFGQQWAVFERGMRMVLPDARIVPLDVSHPIFNSFFRIETLEGMHHPATTAARAVYLGIFEHNDPTQRLMVVISYNNDIGDYMEWSGDGWYPVNLSNDAYKFATNFYIYGLMH